MILNGETIAFFVLSVMAISGAVFMIQFNHVVHMALSLAFTFLSIAGIYFLLDAQFLAVIQVLIYAGAITILMLFGIMLTSSKDETASGSRLLHIVLSTLGVSFLFGTMVWIFYRYPIISTTAETKGYTLSKISESIFGPYAIPFELTSILLLISLIGAILLARKEEV